MGASHQGGDVLTSSTEHGKITRLKERTGVGVRQGKNTQITEQ